MTIRTFSGAHPFRPACLTEAYEYAMAGQHGTPEDDHDAAVEFTASALRLLDSGFCPRCGGPFTSGTPEIPIGCRVTDCRCIPICAVCGEREAIISTLDFLCLWEWRAVVDVDPDDDWNAKMHQEALEREMAAAAAMNARATTGFLAASSSGDPVVIHEDGVGIVHIPDTGGWAKFGFDDTADREERER